jgi:MFS family permease
MENQTPEQVPEQKEKRVLGLERNIFFTGITSFLTDTSVKMIYSVMPLFLMSIGASKTELSLIEGIAESTSALLKAVSGWWSDKIGKNKPFMVFGYAVTAVITPLYALVVSPLQVLFLRFIERTGKGVRTAPRDSLIASSAIKRERGKGFGFHKAMDNAGAILGPLMAFWLLLAFPGNYRRIFLIATIPAVLGVITVLLFIKEAKKRKEDLPGKIRLKDFSKRYYLFLFIAVIFTLGNSTDALLLVKAEEVGIKVAMIPLVYMVLNSVAVFLSVPMGSLSDRIGREKLIIFGFLLYSLVYFGFGTTQGQGMILLLFALYGVYSAATDGVQKALVSDLVDQDKKGTALGLYNAILGITLLPASLIAGVLYDNVSSMAAFYFGAMMAFIAAIMMFIFYKTKSRKAV